MKIIAFVITTAFFVFYSCVPAQTVHAQVKPEQAAVTQPDRKVQGSFEILLAAVENDDYQGAVALLNDQMKTTFTKPLFERIAAKFSPRLKQGYESIYLGDLKKKGYTVHLWKLAFDDKGDDVLAELSIKSDKVDGFYLRG